MFSATATYAMTALSCLAPMPPGEALLGHDLAQRSGVPANYLGKVLLVLKRAGFVEATRGTGGGYQLSRPAAEISLMEIVELFDPEGAHPGCLLGSNRPCSEIDPCPAHVRWRKVTWAYTEFLTTTTLDQISDPRTTPREDREIS